MIFNAKRTGFLVVVLFTLGAWNAAFADDTFAPIARSVATPTFSSFDAAAAGYADGPAMLRTELAYQVLSSLHPASSPLDDIWSNLNTELSACNSSMLELHRLDGNSPDYAGLASKALMAAPGLMKKSTDVLPQDRQAANDLAGKVIEELFKAGVNAYQTSEERSNYQRHYELVRRQTRRLVDVAAADCKGQRYIGYGIGIGFDLKSPGTITITGVEAGSPAAGAGITIGDQIVKVDGIQVTTANDASLISGDYDSTVSVVVKRGGQTIPLQVKRRLDVSDRPVMRIEIHGSFDGFYTSDVVNYTNISGVDLTNVSMLVKLDGRHGTNGRPDKDSHFHFIDRWKAGETRVVRYASSAARGIVTNESVDQIDTLSYSLYSDQYKQTDFSIAYTGPAYDADVKHYVNDNVYLGTWYNYDPSNLFFNSGFEVSTKSGYGFRASHITIQAWKNGQEIKGFVWSPDDLFFSGDKKYYSDAGFNSIFPDTVKMIVEFPYTDYKVNAEWAIRN